MPARVLSEIRGDVLELTLNRPDRRNAFDGRQAAELAAAIDEFEADAALRVAVITGASRTFSSGTDLAALEAGESMVVPPRGFYGMIERPPDKPVVAAVEGYAVGGGFELALACDLIVAAEGATFGLPEVGIGMYAGAGGVARLVQRVPYHRAMELALTGRLFPASLAYELALVSRLAPDGQALAAARELAAEVAAQAPLGVKATLEVGRNALTWDEQFSWRRQAELVERVLASEDAAEGAAAFRERRRPEWRGR